MLSRPRWLLHIEAAAIFLLSLFFYRQGHFGWGRYALLFLLPDLSMLGYVANAKVGAALYNLTHTSFVPVCLLLFAFIFPLPFLPYALVWISHIAFDRMLGYGLKYPTGFRDTHCSVSKRGGTPAAPFRAHSRHPVQ